MARQHQKLRISLLRCKPSVGYFDAGGQHFHLTDKPSWYVRLAARCLLQWRWVQL